MDESKEDDNKDDDDKDATENHDEEEEDNSDNAGDEDDNNKASKKRKQKYKKEVIKQGEKDYQTWMSQFKIDTKQAWKGVLIAQPSQSSGHHKIWSQT